MWRKIVLGKLFTLKHGYALKGKFFSHNGEFVVTTPGHFNEAGGFRERSGKEKFYVGNVKEDYILKRGDLVIAMTEQGEGLLGSTASIPVGNYYLHNQRIGLIENLNSNLVTKEYLYFLLNTASVRAQVVASANGAKVRHTSPERIYKVKVKIPTNLEVQNKIANILSAYDELIDNNNQRISLLEQMAEEIYKEWFVRLRFPGHTQTRIVDGVPEGWKKVTLGKLIHIKKGKNITKDTVNAGTVPVVAGGMKPSCFHDKANAKGPVVTVSSSGANAGYVKLYHQDVWASDCSFINKDVTNKVYYIFTLLKLRQAEVYLLQHGSAQPHVYPKDLERLEALQPAEHLKGVEKIDVTDCF